MMKAKDNDWLKDSDVSQATLKKLSGKSGQTWKRTAHSCKDLMRAVRKEARRQLIAEGLLTQKLEGFELRKKIAHRAGTLPKK